MYTHKHLDLRGSPKTRATSTELLQFHYDGYNWNYKDHYTHTHHLITWATCVCEITTKSLRHLNTQILEIVPIIVQTPILFNRCLISSKCRTPCLLIITHLQKLTTLSLTERPTKAEHNFSFLMVIDLVHTYSRFWFPWIFSSDNNLSTIRVRLNR